jgi:hypothetical protein
VRRAPGTVSIALAAAASVCLAYTYTPILELPADGVLSALAYRGFSGKERGFRWSSGDSAIEFVEPGPGVPVRVEIEVSGWRPRGMPAPLASFETDGHREKRQLGRSIETLALETDTSGVWTSNLRLAIHSETFLAGPHDPRKLGTRVASARLKPTQGAFGLRRAPLRVVSFGAGAAVMLLWLLLAVGARPWAARRVGLAVALSLLPGLVLARPLVASSLGPLALTLAFFTAGAQAFPRLTAAVLSTLRGARIGAVRGLTGIRGYPAGILLAVGLIATGAAQAARPSFVVDVGSGRSASRLASFGPLDSAGGQTFRTAARGAQVDLRDLGGGSTWRLAVDVAAESGPRELLVARAGSSEIRTMLGTAWTQVALQTPTTIGWRSGPVLTFPDAAQHVGLRVAAVRVDRGSSWPSLRVLICLLLASLCVAVIPPVLGLSRSVALAAGASTIAGLCLALALDPVVSTPFVPMFTVIAAVGVALSCLAAGLHAAAGKSTGLPLAALIGPLLGFIGWWSATMYPLYRGGHFTFHSSIAEEIWGGRFWIYYLPYPGSMLSRQLQWGNLIFPHPCLYHVIMAPLVGLGPWFYTVSKALLALWLTLIAVCAAVLARRSGGDRAAVFAGTLAAIMPLTYQLLGLGHLMTLLGALTLSLALTYQIVHLDQLSERPVFWKASLLLALALLSYFASVPFSAVLFGIALPFAFHSSGPRVGRALAGVGLVGAAIAFALYYVNWAGPFMSESVPQLLSGAGRGDGDAASSVSARLLQQPGKFTYTFGAWLVPLVAVAGLAREVRRPDRTLLWPWAALLVVFSGLDLSFNFLLKHHYFSLVPVTVGLALVLARLSDKGRIGWVAAWLAVAAVGALGARMMLATALGWIP